MVLADTIIELAGEGYDTVNMRQNGAYTLAANVERLITYADAAIGNELDNVIDGRPSSSMNQLIDGGAGADVMYGNFYGTRCVVDRRVGDVIVEWTLNNDLGPEANYPRRRGVLDQLHASSSTLEDLVLTGTAALTGTGNVRNNRLDGSQNSAANVLTGGLGDDEYVLGAGDTAVENAGEGLDTLIFSYAAGNPTNTHVLRRRLHELPEGVQRNGRRGAAVLLGDARANEFHWQRERERAERWRWRRHPEGRCRPDPYTGFTLTSGNDFMTTRIPMRLSVRAHGRCERARHRSHDRIDGRGREQPLADHDVGRLDDDAGALQLLDADPVLRRPAVRVLRAAAAGPLRRGTRTRGPSRRPQLNTVQTGFNQAFSYTVPINTFADMESQFSLSYSAFDIRRGCSSTQRRERSPARLERATLVYSTSPSGRPIPPITRCSRRSPSIRRSVPCAPPPAISR